MSQDTGVQARLVRRFNRLYMREIGVLNEHLLESPFSLSEVRVLYELARRKRLTATDLGRELRLDGGYLSRLVTRFEAQGFLLRSRSSKDGRAAHLTLTEAGRATLAPLERASHREAVALLRRFSPSERQQLVEAMTEIESILSESGAPYILRERRAGDIGWIVHRQAVLYAEEYGWDETYEALVAEILAGFVKNFDSASERCWIAERHGRVVGSVFLVRGDVATAKLRLLYVEPSARGLGIGRRLVDECIRLAKQKNYERLTLWTNSVLTSARRIYEAAGFILIAEEEHHSFGHDLVGQTWELKF